MASDVEQKRLAVASAYRSKEWEKRVKNMSDEQVVAIYLRLKAQGKI